MWPESINRNETKLCRGLRYHLAEPGYVLIQPPLFAHCVLIGRSLTSDGMSRWSLVQGWEGVNISDLKRGSRVFGRFSFGSGQDYVEEWIQKNGLDELIDRIRHRNRKRALKNGEQVSLLALCLVSNQLIPQTLLCLQLCRGSRVSY